MIIPQGKMQLGTQYCYEQRTTVLNTPNQLDRHHFGRENLLPLDNFILMCQLDHEAESSDLCIVCLLLFKSRPTAFNIFCTMK
jgi:hypothetical protein